MAYSWSVFGRVSSATGGEYRFRFVLEDTDVRNLVDDNLGRMISNLCANARMLKETREQS